MRHRATKQRNGADVTTYNAGSIVLVYPHSRTAAEWITENVSGDRMYFGEGLVVEPRYIGPILDGMREAGLTIN